MLPRMAGGGARFALAAAPPSAHNDGVARFYVKTKRPYRF
jgi:hypothetical protein